MEKKYSQKRVGYSGRKKVLSAFSFSRKRKKSSGGFTILELSIIIGIIGIMTAVSLVSLSPARENEKIKAAKREVASAIKLSQSYALQGKVVSGSVPSYFGVAFSTSTRYGIFYINSSGTQVFLEEYDLQGGVRLTSPANATDFKVKFSVPHGQSDLTGDLVATFSSPGGMNSGIIVNKGGVVKEN